MSKVIIDLNDAAIQLGTDGDVNHSSIGYAVLDQQNLLLGTDAQQATKRLPRWTNNRFWDQLSTDGIGNATASIRHHADLAFAHMELFRQQIGHEPCVLAVPSFYSKAQLGLLLGMAKEAGLNVSSLVDSAILAVAGQPSQTQALFLDVGLHRFTLTKLRTDGALRVTETQTILETGLATFWDRWASMVAEQFIQSSRYDPMHEAASEQLLFNQIPEFIESSSNERTLSFELDLGHTKHATVMSRDQLLSVSSPVYPAIVQGIRQMMEDNTPVSLFVSSRIQAFPELTNSLSLVPNMTLVNLAANQVVSNGESFWEKLGTDSDSVPHITTLGVVAPKPENISSNRTAYLLVGNTIYNLNRERFIESFADHCLVENNSNAMCRIRHQQAATSLSVTQEGISLNGSALNIGDHSLQAGDELTINGQKATVVVEH